MISKGEVSKRFQIFVIRNINKKVLLGRFSITMKILKIILILTGVALIGLGLYNVFVPQEISGTDGIYNQIIGMIGLGVVALLAGAFLGTRR